MRSFGRKAASLAVLAALALGLGGCASIRDHRGYLVDTALADSIQAGIDNRMSVEKTLGRPTFVSQFGADSWYYVSQDTRQAAFRRPTTSGQLVMRVAFDPAGNVASVDRVQMQHVVRLDPDGHKTPTLGRDRSFIEDLFGNIGSVGGPGGAPGGGGGGGPNGS
jgi:outer membrane protein assembly factor BamE (lipoprotein component of BamABCDE complex)